MDLEAAKKKITLSFDTMDAAHGEPVFDEWAIISVGAKSWTVVYYSGPRREVFARALPDDLRPLAETSTGKVHAIGDFEFAPDARGTSHDAMLRLGEATYLVCNNTVRSMAEIRSNARWLTTQRLFFNLSEAFRADPLR